MRPGAGFVATTWGEQKLRDRLLLAGSFPQVQVNTEELHAVFTELDRHRELLREIRELCTPVATGTGGDGDALNVLCFIHKKITPTGEPR